MITFKHKGDYKKASSYLERLKEVAKLSKLDKFGQMGVDALSKSTPTRTGKTASSWEYEIVHSGKSASIRWFNTNENKGVNIAVIIQYGHGTGTGGYVTGIDYINPAMRPIFEDIAEEVWKEVTKL